MPPAEGGGMEIKMREILFFTFSFLLLWIALVGVRKNENIESLIPMAVGCFLVELCMGAIAAKGYSFMAVSINLQSMGMAYFVLAVIIWLYIFKGRQLQKYKLDKWDIYTVSIVIVGFVTIFLVIFTPEIHNQYVNSDAAVHMALALEVIDTGKISNMHFGEMFNAMILAMASFFVNRISLFKVYILSDGLINLINVFVFYILALTVCKNRLTKILMPFFCWGYFIGWPLFNYVIGGFGYLSWGVSLFMYIIYLLVKYYDCEDKRYLKLLSITMIVVFIGLAFAYMLFTPIAAIMVVITFVQKARKQGKGISLKKLGITLGVIVLLGGIVALFCFKNYFFGDINYFLDILRLGGWNHMDLYRDFVVFMPAFLYMGWHYLENHSFNIVFYTTLSIFAFVGVTFILCCNSMMSSYYYYKAYSILWSFLWLILIATVDYFATKDKALVIAYGVAFCIPVIMTLSGADNTLEERGIEVNEKHSSLYPSFYPILDGYRYYLIEDNNWLDDKEALREISAYIIENYDSIEIPLISCDGRWGFWYLCYTGGTSIYVDNSKELLEAINNYCNEGYSYVVIHQNADRYRNVEEEVLSGYDRIYDNGYYGIYYIQK